MHRSAIAIGGALGAIARYGVGVVAVAGAGTAFPWGTLAVNIAGAWVLGLLMCVLPRSTVRPSVRAGLTIGFCGGFTTFSAFAHETVVLSREGSQSLAMTYVVASVALGVMAISAGMAVGALLVGRGREGPEARAGRP
ncbi:MAG: fluoride efflux transporter CrcB [Acidobacteria bacterium]|nr:fluoride efflux transporter CrcB [Acidobacteriota bacterium]